MLLNFSIYTLKDSAVPVERTLVLSFGTPSGQQLVEKVGMLKICEGCIVLVQSWKEKVGGGEVLGTEIKLQNAALGLPLARTPQLPERVVFVAHVTGVTDIKW